MCSTVMKMSCISTSAKDPSAGALLEVILVENARATELLDRFLGGRSRPSVAGTFGRLLDAKAEGLRRHVPAPAELHDHFTEARWAGCRSASEQRRHVGAQAPRAIVVRGERHHQIAIVLNPVLLTGTEQLDQIRLHELRIACAQQLCDLIELHGAG